MSRSCRAGRLRQRPSRAWTHGTLAGVLRRFRTERLRSVGEDMHQLSRIAKSEQPGRHFILLGHSMGSFAAQKYALDYSECLDGLALSGSGALDGLVELVRSSGRVPGEILNAGFQPARTPCDWLSRDPASVDAFLNDPLCFGWLKPARRRSRSAPPRRIWPIGSREGSPKMRAAVYGAPACSGSVGNWRRWFSRTTQIQETR